ncbi:mitogen-activated protein kinase kinase kinase 3 isoform X1 [Daucus carota subsp. sativus]|uniref:mitogen-activated protein kinase kinase kinase 3 isoform X1 n=1 Tax=Daucus carota subsp. sativus TaxID=79200 RepID=UPI0007EF6694|nr:PREDICTED: mitogen-activated protein kinase kinase kinase YODA isoform X1 [Daucus carota subsp. sativus]XP_017228870.1 PREDICTED: mitogen-activated protein kinase kinase kinase YODA isoform X2 [Daucus carota subsp. sativus]
MPTWWPGKKSSKTKEDQKNKYSNNTIHQSLSKDNKNRIFKDSKPRSFDDVSSAVINKGSPRISKEINKNGSGSSGFSGFDSDQRAHPLPRPCNSTLGVDQTGGLGSGSASVSSVSSSGSSDDHSQFGIFSRGHDDTKFLQPPRSPGPGSRVATTTSSPRHPRFSGTSLESPEKLDDGKIECHPLPLPPGSPTSPSTLPKLRTPATVDHSPCQLSKWKKGKLLGRGTFGHVYLGFNSESGQMCAIKEVRLVIDDQTSKECLKQLNQEIALLSKLSQRNIVQYLGSELGEETLSVYLEYVSGGSIHKLLQEYGAFGEPVIQNYTRQILSGLAYLHGRNTVHRDIKGANILVDPNGEIKLADFGMAKHITNCTSMLSFKGSPYWMAPEVVMNSNGYNLAVDIWSLGCTILEMATSKPPWGQYEGVAAIFKIGNSKEIPEIPNHLSPDAKNFIRLCLQRDPVARPTAAQLLEHAFVRDQATTRVANVNITKEAFPHTFDGSRTPTAQEMRSNRTNISSFDGDHLRATKSSFDVDNFRATKSGFTASRDLIIPRNNARNIISLPVSPTSSPLRQYGPAYQSCYLSPPHPSFAMPGQSSYNNSNEFPVRSNTKNFPDPWFEIPQYKSQTPPNRSPRRGPI